MKAENRTAAGVGVRKIGETGFDSRGLVAERQRTTPGGEIDRKAVAISIGLEFDLGQRITTLLCFDDARCVTIHIQEVVGKTITRSEQEFANCYGAPGFDINPITILDNHPESVRRRSILERARSSGRPVGMVVIDRSKSQHSAVLSSTSCHPHLQAFACWT